MGCGCGKKQTRKVNKNISSKVSNKTNSKNTLSKNANKSKKIAAKGSEIRKARLTRLISPPRK